MLAAWPLMRLWGGAPRCNWHPLSHAALHAEGRPQGRCEMATAHLGWPLSYKMASSILMSKLEVALCSHQSHCTPVCSIHDNSACRACLIRAPER